MQVHRTRADGAAARQRNLALTKAGNQRPERPNGCTHGFHQIVRRTEDVHITRINVHGTITLNFRTQLAQQLH
ncbi:hypothetical protein SDC9_191729 [bioreactor metagenome]|uniref:Uncharacterized protein n=1 Tax=bioreactor metagenome TaxID=1076179 RepID=A0A645HYT9_9ZZZZ